MASSMQALGLGSPSRDDRFEEAGQRRRSNLSIEPNSLAGWPPEILRVRSAELCIS
jgi:hypothetical protein